MPEQYISIDHLNTQELARLFCNLQISKDRSYKDSQCWHWTKSKVGRGYARFRFRGKYIYIHRLIYAWLIQPIPANWLTLQIDHLCKTPDCWNPLHLELVTQRVNVLRGATLTGHNARKTSCKNGHPFTGANLIITKAGRRKCRTCTNALARSPKQKANRKALQESYKRKRLEQTNPE